MVFMDFTSGYKHPCWDHRQTGTIGICKQSLIEQITAPFVQLTFILLEETGTCNFLRYFLRYIDLKHEYSGSKHSPFSRQQVSISLFSM
jgi:hypothetical protein